MELFGSRWSIYVDGVSLDRQADSRRKDLRYRAIVYAYQEGAIDL
jgi:hypothetical protein